MASALFEIDVGSGYGTAGEAANAAASATINCRIANVSGIVPSTIDWSIFGSADSAHVTPTITTSGNPIGQIATFTLPAGLAQAWGIRCKVNGGTGSLQHPSPGSTATSGVYVLTERGDRVFFAGETLERNSTHGGTEDFNDFVRYGGRTPARRNATASQGAGFATDTYVTNSGLLIPSGGMAVGQLYRWAISLSKTAAGTAAAVVTVRIGSAQTTADTARLALTASVAQTAAAANGILHVMVGVRSVSATGVIAGGFGFSSSVGFGGGADGASSTFNNTSLAGQYVGLSIDGGASAAWTITHVAAELIG